jgi:3',5'-cyclic AMP phosphodiesterase CpdA
MTPLTIAHLSDFHLSAEHRRNNIRKTRRALEYVKSLNVDHIIVTGDITANGHPADYRIARSLFASSGLLDSRKLTVTVGNHDVFGGVHTAEDVLAFPNHCKATDYKAKVQEFGSAFQETFDHTLRQSEKRFFPFTKVIGDVAIIGVNTVAEYSRFKNPIGSNGEVDDKSFEQLVEHLESPLIRTKRRVVALHHHFCRMGDLKPGTMHSVWGTIERHTMKLRGKSRLLKLFARTNVELVLHGHVHEAHEYVRDEVRFLNAGGSVLHDQSPDLFVNIVRMTETGCHTEIHRLAGSHTDVIPRTEPIPLLPCDVEARHEAA